MLRMEEGSFHLSGISLHEPRKCCIPRGLGEWRQNSPSGPGLSAHLSSPQLFFLHSQGVPQRDPAFSNLRMS